VRRFEKFPVQVLFLLRKVGKGGLIGGCLSRGASLGCSYCKSSGLYNESMLLFLFAYCALIGRKKRKQKSSCDVVVVVVVGRTVS
jgi:hypothetical protein